ncbi:hypothetical protein NGRA_2092 [Nosema granulosis]|uniref:Uncharacterized protein n=1 Tax=Nosema granulosis TaxID=83296 RepID=A0A9P6GXS6_9MICR|nr:hypothetical protein NGRA_2092 [Nosema granulosis]
MEIRQIVFLLYVYIQRCFCSSKISYFTPEWYSCNMKNIQGDIETLFVSEEYIILKKTDEYTFSVFIKLSDKGYKIRAIENEYPNNLYNLTVVGYNELYQRTIPQIQSELLKKLSELFKNTKVICYFEFDFASIEIENLPPGDESKRCSAVKIANKESISSFKKECQDVIAKGSSVFYLKENVSKVINLFGDQTKEAEFKRLQLEYDKSTIILIIDQEFYELQRKRITQLMTDRREIILKEFRLKQSEDSLSKDQETSIFLISILQDIKKMDRLTLETHLANQKFYDLVTKILKFLFTEDFTLMNESPQSTFCFKLIERLSFENKEDLWKVFENMFSDCFSDYNDTIENTFKFESNFDENLGLFDLITNHFYPIENDEIKKYNDGDVKKDEIILDCDFIVALLNLFGENVEFLLNLTHFNGSDKTNINPNDLLEILEDFSMDICKTNICKIVELFKDVKDDPNPLNQHFKKTCLDIIREKTLYKKI